ncbi:hypothetical protein BC936DRAFT_145210 [Jimgerdemannia flammicorona]|uniref:Uncharacterized protein n=1 Tax=Jimgerdemannia flammicorona TaxID=994334 RepID=A0A433DAM8_9FUNG|nr:hypothetical protein BC936DRAFT_145210 [Jimgerdemannia flammicorona]
MSPTLEEKLQKGKDLKDQGNEAFKNGKVKDALRSYHEAVLWLAGIDTAVTSALKGESTVETNPSKLEAKKVLGVCYSNMAACLLKEGETKFPRVIEYCNKAIAIDADNKKARFRRAQAYIGENNVDKAREDLELLAKSDPDDAAVKREMKRVQQKDKQAVAKQRKEFAGLFERLAKEEDAEEKKAGEPSNVVQSGIVGEIPDKPKIEEIKSKVETE